MRALILLAGLLVGASFSCGAQTAAEVLERARAEAREIEDLKKALNGPDQNLRVAAFQAMATSDQPHFREVAMDFGLASADATIRGLTLKTLIDNAKTLVIELKPDPESAAEVQAQAKTRIETKGSTLPMELTPQKDARGYAIAVPTYRGSAEVAGTEFRFRTSGWAGALTLRDDALLEGPVTLGKLRFVGAVRLH